MQAVTWAITFAFIGFTFGVLATLLVLYKWGVIGGVPV